MTLKSSQFFFKMFFLFINVKYETANIVFAILQLLDVLIHPFKHELTYQWEWSSEHFGV